MDETDCVITYALSTEVHKCILTKYTYCTYIYLCAYTIVYMQCIYACNNIYNEIYYITYVLQYICCYFRYIIYK